MTARRPRHVDAARAWAQEQRLGAVSTKATLLILAGYADEDALSTPGEDRVADETEQDVRTVRRHLELLREAGLIVTRRRYDSSGLRLTDEHHLQLDRTVTAGDIRAAKGRLKARRSAPKAAPLPDTVSGDLPDKMSGPLPDTMSAPLPDIRGGVTGHDVSGSSEVLPTEVLHLHACNACEADGNETASGATAGDPTGAGPRQTAAAAALRERLLASPAVVALRRALAVEQLDGPSWARLTAEQLAEVVCLVDSRGAARMARKARHQARAHQAGPPAHVSAWLPAWREMLPLAPEGPAEAARQEVPPEEQAAAPEPIRAMLEARRARTGGARRRGGSR